MTKHAIKLTAKERQKLLAIVSIGRNQAVVIRRVHILLKSAEGKTDREICEQLYIGEETGRRTRLRFCEDGLGSALADKPRPGAAPKVTEGQETHLTALSCTQPPADRARSTLQLLAWQRVPNAATENIRPERAPLF